METDIRHDGSKSEFRETLEILWRHKGLVVVTALIVTALITAMFGRGAPQYEASSLVVIRPLIPPGAFQSGSGSGGVLGLDASTKDERQIAQSRAVLDIAREELKLDKDDALDISVEIVSEHTMRFLARAGSGAGAAKVSNEHARAYLLYRQETTERALLEIIERTKGRIDALVRELAKLDRRVLELAQEVGGLTAIQQPGQSVQGRKATLSAQIVQLNSIRTEKLFQLTSVRTRYDDAQASAGRSSGGGEILELAEAPAAPSSPKPVRSAIIGLILGLGLGVAIAFLRNHFDSRIRSEEEVSNAMGVQVLGVIARSPAWRRAKEARLDSIVSGASPAAEDYRTLRQALIRSGIGRDLKTILVTSGGRRAGKSALAANLGVQFARAGMRTVVVSADTRWPRVHEFFGMENRAGFSEFVRGETSSWSLPQTKVPNLWLLSSGSGADPSTLLDGPEMRPLMERLAEAADVIIIDSPALCAGADAAILAPYADVTLLAMRQGKARTEGTVAAVRELSQVGASRIGAVLTVVRHRRGSYRFQGTLAPRQAGQHAPVVVAVTGNGHAPNGHAPNGHSANGHAVVNGEDTAPIAVVQALATNGKPKPRRTRASRAATAVVEDTPTENE